MFRRSRFSVRPNVSTVGRTATAASQETSTGSQEVSETQKETNESSSAAAVTDKADVTPSENPSASGDGNDQNGEGASSFASVQRRKRFSIKPKVAPGRPPVFPRTSKSPVKAASAAPADASGSAAEKPSTSSRVPVPRGLQSPRRRRLTEDGKQQNVQPKLTSISSESQSPSAEDSPEQTHQSTDGSKQAENISGSQVKEVPPRLPDRVPPSLPDKEASEISEKAKTLMSSKNVVVMTPSAMSLSRLLNDPSDVQRLIKAQKLRELLKQERCKEQRRKKAKARQKEFTLDPTKMTMRDLIHYLPTSNPMMSRSAEENETVLPPSPQREKSPERAQPAQVIPAQTNSREVEEEEGEGEGDAATEEDQEEALMVPQVKVAEDGSLIIDEESLTVEVQRAKGPNPAQDREPIFERGSTTTYSSFKKANYTKPWSIEETDMFFLAVSMVGTDFSMICQLFPHRARLEIKNKFKKEERANSWRIDKAFREKRKLDIEYFSKLLEKVLEVQKDRKKLKSLAEKNKKTKAKRKKSAKKLSDVEEEDEEEVFESEDGGEKENEEQWNEGEEAASEPKKKRTKRKRAESLSEEPSEKKTKTGETGIPEDSEAALPEDNTNSDMSENVQTAKEAIKPAKLSRGRAPKPVLPLGLKRSKNVPPSRKDEEPSSDKGEKSLNKEESDLSCSSKKKSSNDDIYSEEEEEEEEAIIRPQKPTRYGRVPKPTQTFMHPSQDDPHSSVSEATPATSKPKCTVKRKKSLRPQLVQKPKKSKLVTLRSSKSDFSDEDSEKEDKEGGGEQHLLCSSSNDTDASAFMTSSLHPPNVFVSEVDEAMVELDILDSMPDMLGISQDALCPDSSCQKAQDETGTAEPCEHQLDLLVDVIEFLSSEHTEDSQDESYNEAAQTLLTIGSLTHVSQSAQSELATQDLNIETTPVGMNESNYLEEESVPVGPEQNSATALSSALGQEVTEMSQTGATIELQSTKTDSSIPHTETSDQTYGELKTVDEINPTPHKSLPVAKARQFSTVKPKPKLGPTSRTSRQTSQQETSSEQEAKESCTHGANQVSETITALEKSPKTTESTQELLENKIPPTEVKLTGESVTKSSSSSESQFEPSSNQATREKKTSDSLDERFVSPGERTESGFIKHPSTSPAEDLPVSQKGDVEVAASRKSIGSRLPKVKPKPNLTRTSRPARSKSQIGEETVGKDTLPSVKPQCQKGTKADVEPQPMSTSSSGFKLTEDLPAIEEIRTQTEVVSQASVGAALSDQSATENQLRDTRSTSEHTEENQVETSSKTMMSDLTVTEPPPVGQGLNIDLMLTHEGSDNPVTLITPVEETTVNKEESKVAATCQLRRGRLQKIKPKPNISQTSRAAKSKPQTTEEPIEKDSSADVELAEVEPQKVGTPSQNQIGSTSGLDPVQTSDSSLKHTEQLSKNEKTSVALVDQMDTNTSDHNALENQIISKVQKKQRETEATVDSFTDKNLTSHSETKESHTNNTTTGDSGSVGSQISLASNLDSVSVQEQRAVDELVVSKRDCEAASAHQFRRSRLSKVKPKPNVPQTSRSAKFKPQTTEEPEEKHLGSGSDSESNKKTNDVEPQATCNRSPEKRTVSTDPASGAKSPQTPGPSVTSSEELLISQEKEKVKSFCQPAVRSQKIKPKPNLAQISRRTKSQVPLEAVNKYSSSTSAPDACNKTASENTDIEPGGEKDLGVTSAQSTSTKPNPSEVQPEASSDQVTTEMKSSKSNDASLKFHVGTSESGLKNTETSLKTKAELQQKQTSTISLPETSSQDKSGDTSLVSVPSQKLASTQKSREELSSAASEAAEQQQPQKRQRFSKVKPNLGSTSRITRRKLQSDDGKPSDDQHMDSSSPGTSEQLSAKDNMPKIDPAEKYSSFGDCKLSTPVTESNTQKRTDQTTTDVQSTIRGTTSTVCPIPLETGSLLESTDQRPSELTESSKTPREAPQTRRGRLIKPKPNLPFSSRPQSSQKVPNTKPTEPDSSSYLKGANASADHRPASELRPDEQNPVKEVTDKLIHEDCSSNDAHPSDGATQTATNQNESTSSAEGVQSYPLLSEILPAEVPLDPDEPFFILSLTEIPVSSVGVGVNNSSEQLSHLPVTDSSKHEESVSAESLEAVRVGSDVSVQTAPRKSSEVGNKDTRSEPPGSISEVTTSPVCVNDDPTDHQAIQPLKVSKTTESNKTETLTSKQTSKGPGRKGKVQVKSTATRKKQISHAASETESGSDKTVTEPHEGAGDHIDTDKKTVSSERKPDSCSASQTAQNVGSRRQSRTKAKGFPSFVSESSTSRTLQKPAAVKRTSAEPSVSLSSDVPKKTHSQPSTEVCSSLPDMDIDPTSDHPTCSNPAPSIQHGTAEASSPQEEDSALELTNVSQYFLSDIFTEVEEE